MRIPREVWWLAVLVALMLVVVALMRGGAGGQREGGFYDRTTYSSRSQGLRALYLTLRELGYDSRRLHTPFAEATLPQRGSLIIVDPSLPLMWHEWEALGRWVAAGHTLLLAGRRSPQLTLVYPELDEAYQAPPLTYAHPDQPTYLARGVEQLAVRSAWRIERPGPAPPKTKLDRQERRRLVSGFNPTPRGGVDAALDQAAPLFSDRKGTVVAYVRMGRGVVILLSGGWGLSNEGIKRADNLTFALNAVGPPGAAPVYFDEYHHGYGENLLWTFVPLPIKVALAQMLLALLVVMYARGRRFGAIVPLDRGRRERSEFLGTMTALLRKGQATRLALRTAYDAAMQRLRLELGLAADAGPTEVTRAAGRVTAQAAEKLGVTLRQCRGALEGPETLTEARAVALVRQLDDAMGAIRQI